MRVGARDEAAFLGCLEHFREISRYLVLFQIDEAEAPETRGVDDIATVSYPVHFVERGGMFSLEMGR